MAFLATVRRQSAALTRSVPALRAGCFALYTPSQALTRFVLQSNKAAPSPLFGLLIGTLDNVNYFARDEGAAWLADMARGICCPSAVADGLLVHDSASDSWREVVSGEPLAAASYLYQPPENATAGLQTLYQRTATLSSAKFGGAERVRSLLDARDGVCWISRAHVPLSIARILPKNMPLADKQRVLDDFGPPGDRDARTAPLTRERDVRLLLFLTAGLEHYFERFWLGFRRSTDTYVCHSFIDGGPRALNTFAIPEGPMVDFWPPVHGLPISPPNPHCQADDLPPAALFEWHYLQCVLKKFAHADYRGVPGIRAPPAEDWFDTYDFDYDPEEDFDWPTRLNRAYARLGAAGRA